MLITRQPLDSLDRCWVLLAWVQAGPLLTGPTRRRGRAPVRAHGGCCGVASGRYSKCFECSRRLFCGLAVQQILPELEGPGIMIQVCLRLLSKGPLKASV
jgi:hypothetical protein